MEEDQICFLMDNSPVHLVKDVASYMRSNRCSCIFLPQYTPEMAPVELFFCQLKRMISMKRTNEVINLTKKSGRQILVEMILSIDQVLIIKIWKHFIATLGQMIGERDSILII